MALYYFLKSEETKNSKHYKSVPLINPLVAPALASLCKAKLSHYELPSDTPIGALPCK